MSGISSRNINQFKSVHKRNGNSCAQVNFHSSGGHLLDVQVAAGMLHEDEEIGEWK